MPSGHPAHNHVLLPVPNTALLLLQHERAEARAGLHAYSLSSQIAEGAPRNHTACRACSRVAIAPATSRLQCGTLNPGTSCGGINLTNLIGRYDYLRPVLRPNYDRKWLVYIRRKPLTTASYTPL